MNHEDRLAEDQVETKIQLAQVAATQAQLTHTLNSFISEVRGRWVREDEHARLTEERLDKIDKELSVYGTIYKVVKFAGAAAVLVLTLKLGDIPSLWAEIFHK